MKKKIVSSLLVCTLALASLVGCGNSNDTPTKAAKEEVDMDEDPYEVAIQVVTLPGTEVENEAEIEAAINEITLPAINCTVDIQYVWISEIINETSLGVASDEKMDILHVATLNKLSTLVGKEIFFRQEASSLLRRLVNILKQVR